MRRERSIDPDYFEALFRDKGDPWSFETSDYEAAKYDETLAALPRDRYGSGLEVGCANGVLTARLGPRCNDLLAVDVSPTALAAAKARCAGQPHIRFEQRQLPGDQPAGSFDLVMLSEVVYYWEQADVVRMADCLKRAVRSGGDILLVHWTGLTDYPLSGDDAVRILRDALDAAVVVERSDRREQYRLDLWRRG